VINPLAMMILASSSGIPLGRPIDVDYGAPASWEVEPLSQDSAWEVISQDQGRISLIPLALDTLDLPALSAWSGTDTIELPPPVVVVARSMPDTLYQVAPFPAPAPMHIPPGFPEDYVGAHRFWLEWGGPPGTPYWAWLLPLIPLAALAWFLLRRRRRTPAASGEAGPADRRGLEQAALDLLDSPMLASGDWQGLFTAVDLILRAVASARSGLPMDAVTWGQAHTALRRAGCPDGFIEDARELVREITLQRYAAWGTTRDRAVVSIRRLAEIAGRWKA
jgi:hypothetical protein